MATPSTLPDTPDVESGPDRFLSNMFGGTMDQETGLNKIIHDIAEAWNALGSTASAADRLAYLRAHNGTNKGANVPLSALEGLNPLVNAGFLVWQDGTSFAAIANGTWGPDNWIYIKTGAGVHTLARSADVPSVAQAERTNYSLHLDVTTADASVAAGDVCSIATRMEGYRWARFDQKEWSLRFWVKAAKTGIHCVYAQNAASDRSCVVEYTVNAVDTWEEKQVTFPANPSTVTWNYTNGRGIEIGWTQYCGSTFQTGTPGVWVSTSAFATANQVNELDNTANNFRIALIGRPTLGAFGMPYVSVDPDLEEYRAKRYNEVMGGVANSLFGSGPAESTTKADVTVPVVPKRAVSPTITVGTIGNLSLLGTGLVALTALANLAASNKELFLQATVAAGLTAGQAYQLYAGGTEQLKITSRIP